MNSYQPLVPAFPIMNPMMFSADYARRPSHTERFKETIPGLEGKMRGYQAFFPPVPSWGTLVPETVYRPKLRKDDGIPGYELTIANSGYVGLPKPPLDSLDVPLVLGYGLGVGMILPNPKGGQYVLSSLGYAGAKGGPAGKGGSGAATGSAGSTGSGGGGK